jgi:hypothetical protein
MEFLLDKAALKGLSEEDQQAVKDQALNQFLLGSVFGGKGIASGYEAVQNIIPSMQKERQKAGLLQELTGIQKEFFPTPTQAASRAVADMPELTPEEATARQQQILNQPIDMNAAFTRLGRLATNPNAAQYVPTLTKAFENLQPKFQNDLRVDVNGRVIGGLPTQKEGIQSQFNPQTGMYSANPVQNYMLSQILTKAPETSANMMLGVGPNGAIQQMAIPGAEQAIGTIEAAKAYGQAAGQVEEIRGPDGRMYKVPRSTLLNQPTGQAGANQPRTPQVGIGGAVSKISPGEEAINQAAANRYNEFTKTSLDSAMTVGDRKMSAEYLYNAADQLDPNKATEFLATGASYIRAIPGVGDKFDSFVGNVNLLNKTRSEGVLKGLNNIKGNANAFEGGIVDRATTGVADPKFVTKYVSALEIAAADKDDARQRFLDNYSGDPKAVYTAWQNSPENPRLYNHPKVNQFLNEQVQSWQKGGAQGAPVLPSGFTAGRSKSTGAILIKKPDGTTYTVGQ